MLVLVYFALGITYFFVFALASVFPYRMKQHQHEKIHRFAVLIPAYKEDAIIADVCRESLKQDYPSDYYDVVVVADSFQDATIEKIKQMNIQVVEVSFERSTKSKALNAALDKLPENRYDLAVILDADNIMKPNFLSKINQVFTTSVKVVQGHRIAKNMNTPFAILDAISEEINNNIFRRGHRNLGFSSALIGSAMAFRYAYLKNIMADVNAIGGFDKQLELKIIKRRDRIEYLEDAFVLDEKIQNSRAFTSQRKRWISAQLYYLRKDFLLSFWHWLSKGNLDYFNKAFQFVQLPRVLMLGLVMLIAFISLFVNKTIFSTIWLVLWAMMVAGFFLATPKKFYQMATLKALMALPKGFLLMFISLLFHKKAKTEFIHTEHTINEKP
jgi:cellulose synthase/poly-beta-1,6-N-acetylglucosamine synthase-like glycosyltransferase